MQDKKGRFAKDDDGYSITFKIPSLKKLFYWSIIFLILIPWIIVVSKNNAFDKISEIFESLIKQSKDKTEGSKKNGLISKGKIFTLSCFGNFKGVIKLFNYLRIIYLII